MSTITPTHPNATLSADTFGPKSPARRPAARRATAQSCYVRDWRAATIRTKRVSGDVRAMLAWSADHMDADGTFSVPRDKITSTFGRNARTVGYWLAQAVKAGLIERVQRGYRTCTAVYRAVLPGRQTRSPSPSNGLFSAGKQAMLKLPNSRSEGPEIASNLGCSPVVLTTGTTAPTGTDSGPVLVPPAAPLSLLSPVVNAGVLSKAEQPLSPNISEDHTNALPCEPDAARQQGQQPVRTCTVPVLPAEQGQQPQRRSRGEDRSSAHEHAGTPAHEHASTSARPERPYAPVERPAPVSAPVPAHDGPTATLGGTTAPPEARTASRRGWIRRRVWPRTEIDPGVEVTASMLAWVKRHNIEVDVEQETWLFVEHALRSGRMEADWEIAWRRWIRKAEQMYALCSVWSNWPLPDYED